MQQESQSKRLAHQEVREFSMSIMHDLERYRREQAIDRQRERFVDGIKEQSSKVQELVAVAVRNAESTGEIAQTISRMAAVADWSLPSIVEHLALSAERLGGVEQMLANPTQTAAAELYRRGSYALASGWLDEAEADLAAATSAYPYNPRTWFNLGVARQRSNSDDAAVDAYIKCARYGVSTDLSMAARAVLLAAFLRRRQLLHEASRELLSDYAGRLDACAEIHLALSVHHGDQDHLTRALLLAPQMAADARAAGAAGLDHAAAVVGESPEGPVCRLRALEGIAANLWDLAHASGFEAVGSAPTTFSLPTDKVEALLLACSTLDDAAHAVKGLADAIDFEYQGRLRASTTALQGRDMAHNVALEAEKIAQRTKTLAGDLTDEIVESDGNLYRAGEHGGTDGDRTMASRSRLDVADAAEKRAAEAELKAQKSEQGAEESTRAAKLAMEAVRSDERAGERAAIEERAKLMTQIDVARAERNLIAIEANRSLSGGDDVIGLFRGYRDRAAGDLERARSAAQGTRGRAKRGAEQAVQDAESALSQAENTFQERLAQMNATLNSQQQRLSDADRALEVLEAKYSATFESASRIDPRLQQAAGEAQRAAKVAAATALKDRSSALVAWQRAQTARQVAQQAEGRLHGAWRSIHELQIELFGSDEGSGAIDGARRRFEADTSASDQRVEDLRKVIWTLLVERAAYYVSEARQRSESASQAATTAESALSDAARVLWAAKETVASATQIAALPVRIVPFDSEWVEGVM